MSGHLIHVEAGATVIIGEHPTSAPQDLSPAPGVAPFKGLQYFDVADAGASGSGKPSVVRRYAQPVQSGEVERDRGTGLERQSFHAGRQG